MEELALSVQASFQKQSVEDRITSVTSLKSEVKHHNVPSSVIPVVFDIVDRSIGSSYASLAATGFSLLSHFLKRLYLQKQLHAIAENGSRIFPVLVDRLGDPKARLREQSKQAFIDFWPATAFEVERHVLSIGLSGKNPRTKETSLSWLSEISQQHDLKIRSYVPLIVKCLDDADGSVRETAKMTVVDVFRTAPDHAKRDLKKQLDMNDIRKSIVDYITSHIDSSEPVEKPVATNLPPRPATSHAISRPIIPSTSTNAESVSGEYQEPPPKKVERIHMNTAKEFEDVIRDLKPFFEGKETEQNWIPREKGVIKLRGIAMGNAPRDFLDRFVAGIRSILDGILKVANSLRTTVSTNGCEAVQEICNACGHNIDPMVEILLQNFIKLCGGTKKLSAQNGSNTVDAIVANATPNSKLLSHMWFACQDKNMQPRLFATGWLKTLITKHSHQRHVMEHANGLETLEKCIKKGLGDANPGVRESMRGTYWTFAAVWPDKAELIMDTLDTKYRLMLENHAANPNASRVNGAAGDRPKLSKSTTVPPKPSIKDFKAAQKRAQLAAAKNMPPRPESAQSSFSASTPSAGTAQRPQAPQHSSTMRSAHLGTLSSAPMRPPVRPPRRPELPRPATAEPFSSAAKARSSALKNKPKTASPQPAHTSPRGSPSKRDEDLTMIFPGVQSAQNKLNGSPTKTRTPRKENSTPTKSTTNGLRATGSPASVRSSKAMESPSQSFASPSRSVRDQSPSLMRSRHHVRDASGDLRVSRSPEKQAASRRMSIRSSAESLKGEPVNVYEDNTPAVEPTEPTPDEDAGEPDSLAENVDPASGEKSRPRSLARDNASPMAPIDNVQNHIAIPNDIQDVLENVERDNRPGNSHQLWEKRISKLTESSTEPVAKDPAEVQFRILKGIDAIKIGKMDDYGCRVLQSLIQAHCDVFSDREIYDRMVVVLFEELEKPVAGESTSGKREIEYKTQILVTIHLMMKASKEYFASYHPRAISSFMLATKNYKPQAHILSGLVQSCELVIADCNPADVIPSILDLLELDDGPNGAKERNLTREIGLWALTKLLVRLNAKSEQLDTTTFDRLGKLADQCWRDPRPGVRCHILEYSYQLRRALQSEEQLFGYIQVETDNFRNFFKYYEAKKKGGA